ncbi:hypothetical protein PUNSTDRAFT_72710 [Punctularia strigosozonata HHB-11173 SS5]|uniref:uncharacterized protein n=1 Tax=Punctularia strigosozonata (strain HHB-11173) TaxID=741275 RepID=UPI0004416F3D|nr:uncharacterized protein PUNSTDRAFT_72710 [Punctularia strigosozonata HHB-11173 SS5]EIN06862.1 hypothetical protein PUNSTDRAFT_72710 [Punctularia strigosozonata HHB-11173 SS5]
MTSAGERQHYAIALLNRLFQHLPESFLAGVLYDIGCQLHRSVHKWDLLTGYRERILFGISVFHAYGHEWPCQLTYHPRKCEGFGLSDGEGCERFWSCIDHLFYQRMYVLDAQVQHASRIQRRNLGNWLAKKYYACRVRMSDAKHGLEECAIALEILRNEFASQTKAQTRPLQRQSKDAGKRAIDAILLLQNRFVALEESIAKLEKAILKGNCDADSMARRNELLDERDMTKEKKDALERRLDLRTRQDLSSLRASKYLTHRMNALALKNRIRDRLRQRKFEFTGMERSYRTQSSGESKIFRTRWTSRSLTFDEI